MRLTAFLFILSFTQGIAQIHTTIESMNAGSSALSVSHLDTSDTASNAIIAVANNAISVIGISNGAPAIFGRSFSGNGLLGTSFESVAVEAISSLDYGVFGWGRSFHGALFKGDNDNGFADLILDGGLWDDGDDGVLMSDHEDVSSDLFLVTNDNLTIELDHNDDESGVFSILNGIDQPVLQIHEDGLLEIFNGDVVNDLRLELTSQGDLDIDGTLTQGSDRNRKENITDIDGKLIMELISNLPIYEWQYIGQSQRHIGPMAQDFYKAFKLGKDETSIAAIDADGVALAAIQELIKINAQLQSELSQLKKEIAQLQIQFKSH